LIVASHIKERKRNQDIWIYQEIFDAILEQRLAPGTKLAEDSLADIFDVSRTVIRKVLQRLSHERIVESSPNKGAIVSAPTIDEARDVFQARRVIESGVIRAACHKITDDEISQLTDLITKEDQCYRRDDKTAGIRLSGDFHIRLAEISGNETLTSYLRELVTRTSLIIAQYEPAGSTICTHHDHKPLLDALQNRDAERVVQLMESHLHACEDKLDLDKQDRAPDLKVIFAHLQLKKGA
jgi:DNA-binding GntR family transcriptional regulator